MYSNQHLCMCIRRVLPDGSIGICACFLYSWERTARLAPLHMISICIDLLDSLHMISICISVRRAPPDALPLIIGMCAYLGSNELCCSLALQNMAKKKKRKDSCPMALHNYFLSDPAKQRWDVENESDDSIKKAMEWTPETINKMKKIITYAEHMQSLREAVPALFADSENKAALPPEPSNSAASSAATTRQPRRSNARGPPQRNASTAPTKKKPVRACVAPVTPQEDAPATPNAHGTSAPATPTWDEEDSDDNWGTWGKGSKRMPDAGSTGDEPPPKRIETDFYTRFPHGRPPGMPALDMSSADVEAFARDKAKRPKATRKTAEAKREENRRKVDARKTTWKWDGGRASRWGESPWKWDGKPGESHWAAQGRRRVVAPRKWPVAGSNTSLTLAKPDDHHPCRVVPGCIMIHSVATCSHCLAVSRSTLLLHVYVA